MMRTAALIMALSAITALPVRAQTAAGSSAPEAPSRPGWTFTPSFSFSETYDDNVTLFSTNTAGANNDYITGYAPAADVRYMGRHQTFRGAYSGSFLSYQNLSLLNRWDQRLRVDAKRQQSARLQLFGHTSVSMVPTTEAVDFGPIVYSNTGATLVDLAGGAAYRFGARDDLTSTIQFQSAAFEHAGENSVFLKGGHAASSLTEYRHKLTSRFALGGDYEYRRATVRENVDRSATHAAEAAVDYTLSSTWTVSGGGGFIYVGPSPIAPSRTLPGLRFSADRGAAMTRVHAGYVLGVVPSLGTGGTVRNHELAVSFTTPLFHSRRFYTDQAASFRSQTPIVRLPNELDLRSFRFSSTIGWVPQPWVHVEGYYSNVHQTTLRAGGQVERNRIGIQIVTSKPVRMQ